MSAALIGLAAQVGAPMIRKILAGKIGADNADLAADVVRAIADRSGASVEALDSLISDEPAVVEEAMQEVERMAPEMIALYTEGLERQFDLLKREMAEPRWTWAWRPLTMYALGFLWLWNIILLHVANAVWKIALPQMDLSVLLQLTALYMTLYMGGHTVKDLAANWGRK